MFFDKSFVYMNYLSCRFQTVLARGITRQLRVNPDNVLYTPTVVGFFLCSVATPDCCLASCEWCAHAQVLLGKVCGGGGAISGRYAVLPWYFVPLLTDEE